MKIGILGGGAVGTAMDALFTAAGHDVRVGVRDAVKRAEFGQRGVSPGEAAEQGELVIVAVPFSAVSEALPPVAPALAGKVVVDATNPLNPDWSPLLLGQETSAAEEISGHLPDARVVKAFNTVFADMMRSERLEREGPRITVFVAADDATAADMVAGLAREARFDPVLTGPLLTSRYLEAMAQLNIAIAVGMSGGTDAAFVYDRHIAGG